MCIRDSSVGLQFVHRFGAYRRKTILSSSLDVIGSWQTRTELVMGSASSRGRLPVQDFGAGIHQRLHRFSAEADRLVGNAEGPDKAATRRGRYASTERSLAEAVIESRLSERPSAESSIGGSAEDWQTMADTSISCLLYTSRCV